MTREQRFIVAVLLVLSLLGSGVGVGWADLVVSDSSVFDSRSDDVSAKPDSFPQTLALPVVFLFFATLFVFRQLTVERLLTPHTFFTPVRIPRAPPL